MTFRKQLNLSMSSAAAAMASVALSSFTAQTAHAAPPDFNGDGQADLAVYRAEASDLSVLLAIGDGQWEASERPAPSWVSEVGAVAIAGDFDGDGQTDVAFHLPGGGWDRVPVLLGREDGWELSDRAAPEWAHEADAVALAGDFDGDGRDDLGFHLRREDSEAFAVLLSREDKWSSISAKQLADPIGSVAILGDFDGDSQLDVAFHRPGAQEGELAVLYGEGDGTFDASSAESQPLARQPGVVAVAGDFDGDGATDLALHKAASDWKVVPVLRGGARGSWTLEERSAPAVLSEPGVTALASDFDGDGTTDLVFHRPDGIWKTATVLLASDDRWVAVTSDVSGLVNRPGVVLIAGDHDGDGLADLVAIGRDESETIHSLRADGSGGWFSQDVSVPIWATGQDAIVVTDSRTRVTIAHPSLFSDSSDPNYDVTDDEKSEWKEWVEDFVRFLRLIVLIFQGYEEFVHKSGLNGSYDGVIRGPNQRAKAFLKLEQTRGEVRGRLIVLESTIRLDGGRLCSDYVVPVSVIPVRAFGGLYQASGSTTRDIASIGPFSGDADIDFSFSLETTSYEVLTGTLAIDAPWPCRNQSMTFRFVRRPL